MNKWEIVRYDERYSGLGDRFPRRIVVEEGTLAQARELAALMTSHYPGCDWLFYVKNDPDDPDDE